MIMSRVVKYYYSTPIYLADIANTPTGKTAVGHLRQAKRFTMAMVYDDDSQTIKFGLSVCMPNDNFNKKIGREIAEHNAENCPFHVITNFSGRRNDYADQAMQICVDKEHCLLKREYPWIFNEDNFI